MHVSETALHAGAARFGLSPAALHKIERGGAPDGVVYDVGGEFIVKFVPIAPDRLPVMREKLAFMAYLSANGVRVPPPLPSAGGDVIEVVPDADAGHDWAVTTVPKLPGRHLPPEQWDDSFFRAWGRVMGHMHALSTAYSGGEHIMTWREEHASFLAMCQDDAVRARWEQLGAALNDLPETPGTFGLIHNDLHAWNLLVAGSPGDPGALSVLDFDVCAHHWFMLDIAIALFHPIWEHRRHSAADCTTFARRFKSAWLVGYGEAHTLDPVWFAHLPLFARYRQTLWFLAMSSEPAGASDPWLRRTLADLRQSIVDDTPVPGLDA